MSSNNFLNIVYFLGNVSQLTKIYNMQLTMYFFIYHRYEIFLPEIKLIWNL